MDTNFLLLAEKIRDQLVSWRRKIHQHPELGFQEHKTSALIARTLEGFGLDLQTEVGKTGVVGRLGSGGPSIGLRAEMDALALQEANEVPYVSQIPGLMHACGHDAHTAMLLGAAQVLSNQKNLPDGEIRFLFQPMEEGWDEAGKGGASRMVEDGALLGLDAVMALHVDTMLPGGTIAVSEGPIMAGVDPYDALILGTSSHSGSPHQGINPIPLLAQVVQAIGGIPQLHTDPLKAGLISCEAVHGGSSSGVIPGEVALHGNIRYYDQEVRMSIHKALKNILDSVRPQGGDYRLTIQEIFPPTINDPALSDLIRRCAARILDNDKIFPMKPSMAGEDFSYFANQVPGVYFHLGAGQKGNFRPYHSPRFDIDEDALPVGTAVLAEAAVEFLKSQAETALKQPE